MSGLRPRAGFARSKQSGRARSRELLAAVGLVALALQTGGCWTSAAEGEQLRTAAEARDRRITELETHTRQELAGRMQELESVLEQATALLKRNSADVGAEVQDMRTQLGTLEGQIAELRHQLETLEQQVATQRTQLEQRGSTAPAATVEPPADKRAHYDAAYAAYQQKDYETARALFRAFVQRYPDDAQAGNAQYWIGASYTQENRPATALGEYRKVISDHAKSSAVDVSLYGMADAFFRLRACSDAKAALDALLKRKPKADIKDRAKSLLDEVKKSKNCAS